MKKYLNPGTVNGFSLIELLVVVAIIMVIIGLAFPAYKKAIERANKVNCMSNLQQIHKALMMYSMDNSELYPSNLVALTKILDEPAVFRCKSDRWRQEAPGMDKLVDATADQYVSYNYVTRSTDGSLSSGASAGSMAIVCDKDGANGNVTSSSFGHNHLGDGGHVLLVSGAVKWVKPENWTTNIWGGADIASVVGY